MKCKRKIKEARPGKQESRNSRSSKAQAEKRRNKGARQEEQKQQSKSKGPKIEKQGQQTEAEGQKQKRRNRRVTAEQNQRTWIGRAEAQQSTSMGAGAKRSKNSEQRTKGAN